MDLRAVADYWLREFWGEENLAFLGESVAGAFQWWSWIVLIGACLCVGAFGWLRVGHEDTDTLLCAVIGVLCVAFMATMWLGMMLSLWLIAMGGRVLRSRTALQNAER